jgi:hypothetical protein
LYVVVMMLMGEGSMVGVLSRWLLLLLLLLVGIIIVIVIVDVIAIVIVIVIVMGICNMGIVIYMVMSRQLPCIALGVKFINNL